MRMALATAVALLLAAAGASAQPGKSFAVDLPESTVESVRVAVRRAKEEATRRREAALAEGLQFTGLRSADSVPCEVGYDCRGGKCAFGGCGDGGLGVDGSVGCSGGKCVFRESVSPTCRGGGCVFVGCSNPSCQGGKCVFISPTTTLRGGACEGGNCILDGWPFDRRVGSHLAE